MSDARPRRLQGLRLLVVEDDYTIASDLAETLEEAGAEIVGPAASIEDALRLIGAAQALDGAVLDINLSGQMVYPVADALRGCGVPFVFATGYDAWVVPPAYADVPRHEKPVDAEALSRTLARCKPQ